MLSRNPVLSPRPQIEKLLREKKFNADELCYVAQEKSLVGRRVTPCWNGL